jgi:hypothetical protein
MNMDITNISDNEDGSVTVTLDIDYESLKAFASIGILKVLSDEANRVIEEHVQEERSDGS